MDQFSIYNKEEFKSILDLLKNIEFKNKSYKREGGYYIQFAKRFNSKPYQIFFNTKQFIEIYKVIIPKGSYIQDHLHKNSVEYFFLNRGMEIRIGEKEIKLNKNQVIKINKGTWHKSLKVDEEISFIAFFIREISGDDKIFKKK